MTCTRIFLGILSLAVLATPAAAQDAGGLPTDVLIQIDRLLISVERLLEQEDHEAAFDIMEKIPALYKELNAEKPPEFEYRYAHVAARTGSFQAALDAVHRYLAATGRTGEFYRKALELLDRIEQTQTMDLCTEESWGVPCWKALVDSPQCAIWEESHIPFRSATWSGSCDFGRAHGEGTLSWTDDGAEGSSNGQFQNGKKQGSWFERLPNGNIETGPYVDGVRNGPWTLTTADGSDNDGRVIQGRYVNGKRDGSWQISWPDGQTLHNTYASGIQSGPSVRRFPNGRRREGRYVDRLREGEWKTIQPGGRVSLIETYAKNVLHGPWREVGAYCRSQGNYVEGQKDGDWIECSFSREEQGSYVKGLKQGRWEIQRYRKHFDGYGGTLIERGREGIGTEWYEAGKAIGFHTYTETYHVPHSSLNVISKIKHLLWMERYMESI